MSKSKSADRRSASKSSSVSVFGLLRGRIEALANAGQVDQGHLERRFMTELAPHGLLFLVSNCLNDGEQEEPLSVVERAKLWATRCVFCSSALQAGLQAIVGRFVEAKPGSAAYTRAASGLVDALAEVPAAFGTLQTVVDHARAAITAALDSLPTYPTLRTMAGESGRNWHEVALLIADRLVMGCVAYAAPLQSFEAILAGARPALENSDIARELPAIVSCLVKSPPFDANSILKDLEVEAAAESRTREAGLASKVTGSSSPAQADTTDTNCDNAKKNPRKKERQLSGQAAVCATEYKVAYRLDDSINLKQFVADFCEQWRDTRTKSGFKWGYSPQSIYRSLMANPEHWKPDAD